VRTSSDTEDLWSWVSGYVRRLVPFDRAYWFGIGPSTLLANYPIRVENIEQGHCQFYWSASARAATPSYSGT